MKKSEKKITTNLWRGLRSRHIIQSFIAGVFIALALGAPFLHYKYQKLKDWQPYFSHMEKYNGIIDMSNNDRNLLIDNLEKGELSNIEFVAAIRQLESQKKADLKIFHKERIDLKNEYSFLGYLSYRYFLYAIGLPIFALCVSILLLLFILNPVHVKSLKNFYLISVLGCIYVATFWLSHSFLTKTDFPKWLYDGSINLVALISTAAIFMLIKFFINTQNKISILIDWILEIRNKYIKRLAIRAIEVDEDETLSDVIDFEKRTSEELSKIVK